VVFDAVALVNHHHLPILLLQCIFVPHCHLVRGNYDWETLDLEVGTLHYMLFVQLLAQNQPLFLIAMVHDDWNLFQKMLN
jgi:uncharacterized membrane protein YhfC